MMRILLTLLFSSFLLVCEGQIFTNYTTDEGLPDNSCNDVDVDSNNNIWLATTNGCAKFDGANWTIYDVSNSGIVGNNVQTIYVDSDDVVWVGTNSGVSKFDGIDWTSYTEEEGLIDDQVRDITQDNDNNLWISTGTGISRFDGTNWENYGTGEGVPFGGINDGLLDEGTAMNFAHGLGGVLIKDIASNDFTPVNTDDGLISNFVRTLAQAPNGEVWVGTALGISVLDGTDVVGEFASIFELPPPDVINPVEDITFDQNGNAWVAVYVDYLVTEGGVSVYDGSTWTQFETEDGLAGPVVKNMVVDQDNCVWVTTSTGLSRICDFASGIEEEELVQVNVFPNPASDFINVQIPDVNKCEWQLVELSGRVISQSQVMETNFGIGVKDLSAGIYLLRVNTEKGIATKKIMIK